MATINAYIPQPTPLMFETEEGQRMASACIEYGGWNHKNQTLSPIRVAELLTMPHNPALYWVLDSMAAAAETGRLDAERYVGQLFASRGDVRAFRHVLREAGGDRWLSDRHHYALRKLGNAELDVTTYVGIAGIFDPAE
ncbi:hypothetical protein PQR75_43445 [Paraburkholderia fungorum]|uniref:hypothetical protein n=1 Tax=Paraburkholderia TaxID=1822464 RepID=UPI0038BA11CC